MSHRPKDNYLAPNNKRYEAYTKSEARAALKSDLGIRRKDRLPVGTKLIRVQASR